MKKILFALVLLGFAFSIANPASVYCEKLGYKTVLVETEGGVAGMCRVAEGEEVDEWAFFRGEVAQEYSYCAKEGYGIRTVTEEMDGWEAVYAVCILDDETEVPITELMDLSVGGAIPEEPAEEEETEPEEVAPAPIAAEVGEVTKLPNPASVYCVQQGGTLEIKKDEHGDEYGECTLPEGTVCEEWAFYRRECGPGMGTGREMEFPWIPVVIVLAVLALIYWLFLRK